MKKIIGLILIIACMACLIGCAKNKEKMNDKENNNKTESIFDLMELAKVADAEKKSGESGEGSLAMGFYSTDDKAIFNFDNSYYVEYEFSGEFVSEITYCYVHENEDEATKTFQKIKEGLNNGEKEYENIVENTQDGKYVIVKVKKESFENMTKESVMKSYNTLDNYMKEK